MADEKRNRISDYFLTEKRGRFVESSISSISQICHLLAFDYGKPKSTLDSAMLIFSIDVDVGSSQVGYLNCGRNDRNVHNCFTESFIGDVEEYALPIFVNAFDDFDVPATFAIRGQTAEVAGQALEPLFNAQVKHDVGAHGYSHKSFQTLSRKEAEEELKKISLNLGKFGVKPKSFVFPRNLVSHLDLLEKFDYKCFRDLSRSFLHDGLYIEKKGELYNIQPSLYLNLTSIPSILESILDVAIRKKAPLHLWFHLWTFGHTKRDIEKYIANVFSPFLKYAQSKNKKGILDFETMLSAAEKAKKMETPVNLSSKEISAHKRTGEISSATA